MRGTKRIGILVAVCAALISIGWPTAASESDNRGWSSGTLAAGASDILAPKDPVEIRFPDAFAKTIERETLVIYFSPTCPHCQSVAPEFNALATRLEGRADVIGVSSGSASKIAMTEFIHTYKVNYRVVHDTDRDLASALGVQSTPSVILVRPTGTKKKNRAIHALAMWYPYHPGFDVLIEMRLSDNPWLPLSEEKYYGDNACSACHTQEAEAWALTHHSVAWRTLVKTGDHTNTECVGCHVTGQGEPTGFDGHSHSPLVNVGCEACHGPAGPHDGKPLDASTTCEQCHDDKHSIAFRYEKGLPLIDHYRATAMDDHEFREHRLALHDGTAPRPLLAFEGETVGVAACKSCHEKEHAIWADSPHGSAMGTLAEKGSDDPSCVRCHAAQITPGPPAASLDGFRVNEAVSCESCHGPGKAHVDAGGGSDNIEGLGKSCPVCVLEAVCTRCHTSEWDPSWKLTDRLGQINHGSGAHRTSPD